METGTKKQKKRIGNDDQDLPSVMNSITAHNGETKGGVTIMAVTAAEVMWISSPKTCISILFIPDS